MTYPQTKLIYLTTDGYYVGEMGTYKTKPYMRAADAEVDLDKTEVRQIRADTLRLSAATGYFGPNVVLTLHLMAKLIEGGEDLPGLDNNPLT